MKGTLATDYSAFVGGAAPAGIGYFSLGAAAQAFNTQLQLAIWNLEGEWGSLAGNTVALNLVALASSSYNTLVGVGGVRVLNVWTNSGSAYTVDGKQQSMLTLIPEASSLIGWSVLACAMSGGAWLRRRKKAGVC